MVISLMWTIWMEKNSRFFQDKEMDLTVLFEKAIFFSSVFGIDGKTFKNFSFLLIVLNWKDVIRN